MPEPVKIIEWQHLDKRKFYIFGPTLFCGIRALLYPPNLIKTRLQVQKQRALYKGTMDAFRNIVKLEGFRGLYKGFLVSNFSVLSGQFYITTYELVRQGTTRYNLALRGFLSGACASIVGQTITVPVDIISQKLMVQGQGQCTKSFKLKGASMIIREIWERNGPKGFYKGFGISLMTYGPTSGVWWAAYGSYLSIVGNLVPEGTMAIVVQGICGPFAGLTAAMATNPLDVLRTRLQVIVCVFYCILILAEALRASIICCQWASNPGHKHCQWRGSYHLCICCKKVRENLTFDPLALQVLHFFKELHNVSRPLVAKPLAVMILQLSFSN